MIPLKVLLCEGKTKEVWRHPLATADVLLKLKDVVTAGDGARRAQFDNKGAYSARTAANCFRLLKAHGIPNHFIGEADDPCMLHARELRMIPREVVVRRIATGSFLKRRPDVEEGTRFDDLLVEFFDKDDANHDPLIIYDFVSERVLLFDQKKPLAEGFLREQPMASAGETHLIMERLKDLAIRAFLVLEAAWADQNVTLVDFKIECGFDVVTGEIVIGDVITNDEWRLWPEGDRGRQLDKDTFRKAPEATREVMEKLRVDYARVADMSDAFKLPVVMPAAARR
ncbi:MAG: phosphoribosylaminoimidazolesuccinocarboxamide synthase [bacterium]|nr:phosphoribosylaminoimidazolesuccinocarboxamide synthase [bacterium]